MPCNQQSEDNDEFVHSVDTLLGTEIFAIKSPYWGEKPPLVLGAKNKKTSLKSLKLKCRQGIPPGLRCAVWISSVVRTANPHQPIQISDSYSTVGKSKILEAGWEAVLRSVFPNASDADAAITPDLGLSQEVVTQILHHDYGKDGIPAEGVKSLTRVIYSVRQVLGLEYSPLIPDIAANLLSFMPESHAYATIREMISDASHFMPVSQKNHYSWCKAFEFLVERRYPQSCKEMKRCGALSPDGLDPIFKRCFTSILRREHVLRFMDIFVAEGLKTFFRLGFALIPLISSKELKALVLTDSESWWNEIRKKTLDPSFNFEKLLNNMYPTFGKVRKRCPRRRVLTRVIKIKEKWAMENMPIYIDETPPKPVGFLSEKPVVLAKPPALRSSLAQWLPTGLRMTKLDLIFSTQIHGRSLATFYKECRRSKNTIMLIEVLDNSAIIGMFASHAWNVAPTSFGDGECFLFRASDDPKCFRWVPDFENINDIENEAIREQFMVAHDSFIAMGGNTNATNGLRLNQDLTRGQSHPALGFGNEPLPGDGLTEFDVGIVEVYRLLNELDVKLVDENPVWDLEGF